MDFTFIYPSKVQVISMADDGNLKPYGSGEPLISNQPNQATDTKSVAVQEMDKSPVRRTENLQDVTSVIESDPRSKDLPENETIAFNPNTAPSTSTNQLSQSETFQQPRRKRKKFVYSTQLNMDIFKERSNFKGHYYLEDSTGNDTSLAMRPLCPLINELLDLVGKDVAVEPNFTKNRLELEVDTQEKLDILKGTTFKTFKNATLHENVRKHERVGIVKTNCYMHDSNEEITDTFNRLNDHEPWKIKRVMRITKKKQDTIVPTVALRVIFDTPTLPSRMLVMPRNSQPITLDVPRPTRCFTCHGFAHKSGSERCPHPKGLCINCGESRHAAPGERCTRPTKCANCGEPHLAICRDCSAYKYEAKLLEVATV